MMRPTAAGWFEALLARDDMSHAMEHLATTGLIELDRRATAEHAPARLRDLQALYQEFRELRQRDGGYWPQESIRPSETPRRPASAYERALEQLRKWRRDHDALIRTLENAQREQTLYQHLQRFLTAIKDTGVDFTTLKQSGPWIGYRFLLCPPDCEVNFDQSGLLLVETASPVGIYRLVISDTQTLAFLDELLLQTDVASLPLPDTLHGSPLKALATVRQRLDALGTDLRKARAELIDSYDYSGIRHALGDILQLNWFMQQIEYSLESDQLAWVRGWTIARDERELQQAMSAHGIRGVIHFTEPPPQAERPLTLQHRAWVRPFELFPRLLGMPALSEVDPTGLLAWIVPLLFGYMFGDLGQGFVILLAGLYLQRRLPQLRILIPAGASAMVFGLLYGSVFSIEHWLPPLWLHPMEHPLLLLGIPLAGGALLLLTGLAFDALQAYWQQQSQRWWRTQAPVILMYLSLFAMFAAFQPGLWLFLAGLAWYLGGHASLAAAQRLKHALIAFGELIEVIFQLAINTLSFARVGAFALAHAGLSQTVMALMGIVESFVATAVIFLVGNLIILVLEGLIVSIQTTRLVLFEFFIRFMRSSGRAFRPLTGPTYREETAI